MAVVFFLESRKRLGYSKPFFRAVGIFALFYAVARLIENIRRYSIGTYNDVVEAWIAGGQISGLNYWLRITYVIISFVGIIFLYYSIERYIFTKNRYLITIFSIIQAILSMISYIYFNDVTFWLSTIIFMVPAYFLPILFFNAARKAPSKYVRNGCIFTAIGIILITLAVIIDVPEYAYANYVFGVKPSEFIIRMIAPILLILGVIIATFGLKTHFQENR